MDNTFTRELMKVYAMWLDKMKLKLDQHFMFNKNKIKDLNVIKKNTFVNVLRCARTDL